MQRESGEVGVARALAHALVVVVSAACAPTRADESVVGRVRQADTLTLGSSPTVIDGKSWRAGSIGVDSSTSARMSASYTAPVFELHGSGAGPANSGNQTGPDQVEFVYTTWTGDVDLTARLVTAGDPGSVNAGVMIREDSCTGVDCPYVPMGAGTFQDALFDHYACPDTPVGQLNSWWITSRDRAPDSSPIYGRYQQVQTRSELPVWLRLRRLGKDFSVMHRRDANAPWVPLWGGALSSPDVLIGLFASGLWTTHADVVATFDNVHVSNPLPLEDFPGAAAVSTGFIGATYGADSTDLVSAGMSGFYVDPDGRTYKYAREIENGHSINVTDSNGNLVKLGTDAWDPSVGWNTLYGTLEGGITGDGEHVYLAASNATAPAPLTIERHAAGTFAFETKFSLPAAPSGTTRKIGGMAVSGNRLYVSDFDYDLVRVVDLSASPPAETTASFSFTHPGPIAADHSGRLWIAETPDYMPAPFAPNFGWNFGMNASATIRCVPQPGASSSACTAGGSAMIISGVDNPAALAISPNLLPGHTSSSPDTLLVASNGPNNQNIRTFTLGTGQPSEGSAIGSAKGVFDPASSPGLVFPPGATLPRLFNPMGVGVDSSGDVYVASSAPREEIHKLSGSTHIWAMYGLGREAGAFDPDSNGADFYTLTHHFVASSGGRAGSNWDLKSVTWNPFAAHDAEKRWAHTDAHDLAPFIRTVGGVRYMFYYNSLRADLRILKFPAGSELAVPYGFLRTTLSNPSDMGPPYVESWVDADGDGNDNETHTYTAAPNGGFAATVDKDGKIWLSFLTALNTKGIWSVAPSGTPPAWDAAAGTTAKYPTPELYDSGYSTTVAVVMYDPVADALFASTQRQKGVGDCVTFQGVQCGALSPVVARFDDWHAYAGASTAPTATYQVDLPDPRKSFAEDDDFGALIQDPQCIGVDWSYLGNASFDIAGDMFFAAERTSSTIFAYRASTGQKVANLFVGPETSGAVTWTDAPVLRAAKVSSGDYLLTWYDETPLGANHLIRWTPPSWSPADLSPTAWYVASSTDITDAGGGAVSVWTDRSGHGHDVGMTNSCCRPAYLSNGWNGSKPTVRFDGTSSVLTQEPWPTENPLGTESAFSVLAVAKSNEVRDGTLISWWGVGGLVHASTHAVSSELLMQSRRASPYGGDHTFTGTTDLGTGRHVLAFRYDSGVFRFSVDGSSATEVNVPPFAAVGELVGGADMNQLLIGWLDAWGDMRFKGDISELVFVPSLLADTDVDAFCAYAADRWTGLPTCTAASP